MRTSFRGLGLVLVVLLGCRQGRGERQDATSETLSRIQVAQNAATAKLFRARCAKPEEVGRRCGLIAREVFSQMSVDNFAAKVCGLGAESMDDACAAKFAEMWLARLEERYEFADLHALGRKCRAHPVECRDPAQLEMWWMASHNDLVAARFKAEVAHIKAGHQSRLAELDRQRAERDAQSRRAFGAAMLAAAASLRGGVNCTSMPVGGVVHTSCR